MKIKKRTYYDTIQNTCSRLPSQWLFGLSLIHAIDSLTVCTYVYTTLYTVRHFEVSGESLAFCALYYSSFILIHLCPIQHSVLVFILNVSSFCISIYSLIRFLHKRNFVSIKIVDWFSIVCRNNRLNKISVCVLLKERKKKRREKERTKKNSIVQC